MSYREIELNQIVCIECTAKNATCHLIGGAYFEVSLEVARDLQFALKERLVKVQSIFGDKPPEETVH